MKYLSHDPFSGSEGSAGDDEEDLYIPSLTGVNLTWGRGGGGAGAP